MVNLDWRIERLERRNATNTTVVDEPLSDHFRVSVSCPPDTSVHVRGGNVWEGSDWLGVGYGYYIESYTVDFSDADSIDNYDGNFTNADYYIGIIYGREFFGYDHYVIGGDVEFATAAEAEAYIEDTALSTSPWNPTLVVPVGQGGLPLCGIILRNDGNISVDGAVLPIDGVNRGRSYYWKDLRPRHYVIGSGGPL